MDTGESQVPGHTAQPLSDPWGHPESGLLVMRRNIFFLLCELVESELSVTGQDIRDERTCGPGIRGQGRGCSVSLQLLSLRFSSFLGPECLLSGVCESPGSSQQILLHCLSNERQMLLLETHGLSQDVFSPLSAASSCLSDLTSLRRFNPHRQAVGP